MKWTLALFLVLLIEQETNGTTLPRREASSLKNVTKGEKDLTLLEDLREEKQQRHDTISCIKKDMRLL